MFQNAVIDIAIGLMLMYLVLSLVCTVINEFIATKLKLRAASLESGLKQLLDDPTIRDKFYNHGLINGAAQSVARGGEALAKSLRGGATTVTPVDTTATTGVAPTVARSSAVAQAATQNKVAPAKQGTGARSVDPTTSVRTTAAAPGTEHPSYISADTFVKALLGSLDPTKPIPGIADLQPAIEALPTSNMRDALLAGLTAASSDFDKFRTEVAKWFDDSMERLGGAYKRQLKWISLIIGLAVAVIVNADSFDVGYALWSDNALRAQMVQTASEVVQKGLPEAKEPDLQVVAKAFDDANKALRPLPIGWPLRTAPGWPSVFSPDPILNWGFVTWIAFLWFWCWFCFTKLVGWGVTAFALSLGAPFWFDLLSKFINIRGTGTKPQRATS